VRRALEVLQQLPLPARLLTHAVERWLPHAPRNALKNAGIETLADLTLRVPRRRRWWAAIPGFGVGSARASKRSSRTSGIDAEGEGARGDSRCTQTSPWETLVVPEDVDGIARTRSARRWPRARCPPPTTTRPYRPGSNCRTPRPRSAPTARRPSD
jgi:hypothetical protein